MSTKYEIMIPLQADMIWIGRTGTAWAVERGAALMASIEFDHLVIAAAVLDDGIEFARRTYGLEIPLGGKHDMMATHNAVGRIGPDTYLEVISIDQAAPSPSRTRWFSLDDPANRRRLENDGPRVAHWVCRTDDLAGIVEQSSHDIGRILSLTRGSLAWQIAVRDDGLLFEDGLFPSIIQWGNDIHPARNMTDLKVTMTEFQLHHSQPHQLVKMLTSIGADHLTTVIGTDGPNKICVKLERN